MSEATSEIHRFHHRAMATTWELAVGREDGKTAKWVSEEVFRIVDSLEESLSRFQTTSYISQLGSLQPGAGLEVDVATYECLELARAVHHETHGAFDITVAKAGDRENWQSMMDAFSLDPDRRRVTVSSSNLHLDLGGIGKGFAIDEIVEWLSKAEIEHAFIDAGGSTMYSLGAHSDADGWPVNLGPDNVISLSEQALSASGFEVQGYHVIDPRNGELAGLDRKRSWVFAPSAALADALSTAALVMTAEEIDQFSREHPEITLMLL